MAALAHWPSCSDVPPDTPSRSDDLSVDDEGHTAFDRHRAPEVRHAKADAAAFDGVLKGLRRPLEQRGGTRPCRSQFSGWHAACRRSSRNRRGCRRIDDRGGHRPVVGARFGERDGCGLPGLFCRDGGTVGWHVSSLSIYAETGLPQNLSNADVSAAAISSALRFSIWLRSSMYSSLPSLSSPIDGDEGA